MTELELDVQQLKEDVNNLYNSLAQLRNDIFNTVQTHDELSKALNVLLPRIQKLEDKLENLVNLLKTKGVI